MQSAERLMPSKLTHRSPISISSLHILLWLCLILPIRINFGFFFLFLY